MGVSTFLFMFVYNCLFSSLQMGEKNLDDYKSSKDRRRPSRRGGGVAAAKRPARDANKYVTPR